MSPGIPIKCPGCGTDNIVDIIMASNGSKIVCQKCKKRIILEFKGKTPKQILTEFQDNINRALRR